MEQTFEEYYVETNEDNAKELNSVSKVLARTLDIHMDPSEIISKLIDSFFNYENYVCLFKMTPNYRFSLTETKRLATFGDAEKKCLEYVINSRSRSGRVKDLIDLLKGEIEFNGELTNVNGDNFTLNSLIDELEKEYNNRYRNIRFKSGTKKLIIKASIVHYLYKTDMF